MKIHQVLVIVWSVFGAQKYVTCDFHNYNHWDKGLHHFNNEHSQDLFCIGERLTGIVENCLAVEGSTKEDANDLFAVKPASSEKAKCFRACLMKKCKFMDPSGNFDRAVLRQYFSRFIEGDVARLQLIGGVVENCSAKAKVEGNACETVDDYMTCFARDCKHCELDLFNAFQINKF